VEPIPPTAQALESLSRYGDPSAGQALESLARVARELVPECNGISLTVMEDGVSLTLVASSEETAFLDAMQYLDGGPCVEAVEHGVALMVNERDALDEGLWSLFSRASAAAGVASSLSLPILRDGRVVGGANLYASTRDAFVGRHQELADAIGAWAPGAITDADLSFDRRREAEETARRIAQQAEINVAIGIVAESQSVSADVARRRIADAATRSGLTEVEVARIVREARGLDL
jgi:GAF domain-containing protein